MPRNARFWRNVTLIGLAHVAVIIGFVRWGRESENKNAQSIVWLNGGAGDGAAEIKPKTVVASRPPKTSSPPPAPKLINKETKEPQHEAEQPVLTSAKSEIQLPTPIPIARSTSIPKALPVVKRTPKPKPPPKPTPKPTPRPPPKMILAKASPKPLPKVTPTPVRKDEGEERDHEVEQKEIAKAILAKTETEKTPKAIVVNPGTGKGTSTGAGGHVGGAGGESPFGWYGSMLHDRFYSEWIQPTTAVLSNVKLAVLVKLRIEKDGQVSKFEIIKPSNNVIVDESVAAVAKRVTKVDPLPDGLVKGEHYDVRINFELNSE
jgi:TonB family protein